MQRNTEQKQEKKRKIKEPEALAESFLRIIGKQDFTLNKFQDLEFYYLQVGFKVFSKSLGLKSIPKISG